MSERIVFVEDYEDGKGTVSVIVYTPEEMRSGQPGERHSLTPRQLLRFLHRLKPGTVHFCHMRNHKDRIRTYRRRLPVVKRIVSLARAQMQAADVA